MDHHDHNTNHNEDESGFYKGLFFGLIIGVALIWFKDTDKGKELIRRAKKKIDDALAYEPGLVDIGEDSTQPDSQPEVRIPKSFLDDSDTPST